MDDMTAVKVVLPSSELAVFLATTPVKAEAFADGSGGLLGPDDGWWEPGKAAHLRTGQASLPGARYLNIGVADGGVGQAVVYVVNHGT